MFFFFLHKCPSWLCKVASRTVKQRISFIQKDKVREGGSWRLMQSPTYHQKYQTRKMKQVNNHLVNICSALKIQHKVLRKIFKAHIRPTSEYASPMGSYNLKRERSAREAWMANHEILSEGSLTTGRGWQQWSHTYWKREVKT